jgi:hypothetical protein
MENAKAGCEVQKFTMRKAKLTTLRMSALHMVINGEGLIQQDPAGLQRVDEMREERSMQVEEDEDGIVCSMPEIRLLRRLFQIKHSRFDAGEVSRPGMGRKLREGLLIAINGFDLVAQRGEEQRMTAAAGSHIEDVPFGKAMKLSEEKRSRWRICAEDLLCEPCALNANTDGAGYEGNRGMQLPQPQLDTIDREFIEQSYQESFRQRFQQLRLPSGSDVDDTLSHFRVVDRVNKIIGQSCRLQSTVQFQIDGQGLRASAFIGRHAAAGAELQLLDDDMSTHVHIVEDGI